MVRMINFLRLMQLLTHAARLFFPWIWRFILFALGMIATSVITFWRGVPFTADQIANHWLDRAIVGGFPTQWDRRLYYTFYILAVAMFVFGWVILSYITVWLVAFLFR